MLQRLISFTGQVIGDTGKIGERSQTKPYTAQNVLATIYRHLGIDPSMQISTDYGRKAPLLDDRAAIEDAEFIELAPPQQEAAE